MDGMDEIILFLIVILWMSAPFLFSFVLAIIVGNFFEERGKRFKVRMITWSVLLSVIVPCYYASFSVIFSEHQQYPSFQIIWDYVRFFYTSPFLIRLLAVTWVIGLSIFLLDYFKKHLTKRAGGVSILLEVVFAVLFFNHLGLTVLEYCGFVLVGLSLMMGWLARLEFTKKGGVPKGKSYINTTVLVKSGIYAVVRHPMYTSGIVLVLALTLISQHWLSVVIGTMPVTIFYVDAWEEDKSLVDKFGEDYRIYMHRVPRVNVIIGVLKLLLKRKED